MNFNNIKIEGISIAGEETNIRFPKLDFMFDIGQCPPQAVSIPILLITHGHVDHLGSIAHYLFRRMLKNLPPPDIYAPPSLLKPIKLIVQSFSKIHDSEYPANYHAVKPDKFLKIKEDLYIKSILSDHSIPCNCYSIFKSNKDEIPIISYTGDTTIELLDNSPFLYKSEILILECTFMADVQHIEKAGLYHHIHLNQIIDRASNFKNKCLLLTHQSPRYSRNKIQDELNKKLPSNLKGRVFIL